MPHRPGEKNKIPAALTSYQPRQKEYTCSLSKSACGNGCAIYNSSICTLMDLPHSWKVKKVKRKFVVVVFPRVHGWIKRERNLWRSTLAAVRSISHDDRIHRPVRTAYSASSIVGRRDIFLTTGKSLCPAALFCVVEKRKNIVECFFFFKKNKKWWREIPKLGWSRCHNNKYRCAHLPGYHDGYSRDGHRSQCLSV